MDSKILCKSKSGSVPIDWCMDLTGILSRYQNAIILFNLVTEAAGAAIFDGSFGASKHVLLKHELYEFLNASNLPRCT